MLKKRIAEKDIRTAVIGLGYVGMPLAAAFGAKYPTLGFDLNPVRIEQLRSGIDITGEVTAEEFAAADKLTFSCDPDALKGCDFYIVTVPTPVDCYNRPDLTPLYRASETVGRVMKKGAVVIYESTVYPGCTEEECVPVLEKVSGMKFNQDFFCGYSPERINPGDKAHRLADIRKITSGSTAEIAAAVDMLYSSILNVPTHPAPSIKVAEAAKVIENSQRDLNIAFVNELAKICHLLGIDTNDVLDAAGTKWNFLPFRPGLVGGHCIGVDPYYLTHKAQSMGYIPEVILAGRRINDGMGRYVAEEVIKLMIRKEILINKSRILQLGITFKEDCPDIRNSRSADVAHALEEYGCRVTVFDPCADPEEVRKTYSLNSVRTMEELTGPYDAVVLAVAHKEFGNFPIASYIHSCSPVYDIKGQLPREAVDGRL